MTCCTNPLTSSANIRPPTNRASLLPMAIVQMTIEGRRFAPRGRSWPLHPFPLRFPFMQNTAKIKGICGGTRCSSHDWPSGVNRGLKLLRKWYCSLRWSSGGQRSYIDDVVGVQSLQQVIVTVILGSCHPIISWSRYLFPPITIRPVVGNFTISVGGRFSG